MTGRVTTERIVLVVLLVALIPAVSFLPALATLGVLTLVLCGLIGFETHRYRELRHQVRHAER